MTILHIDSSIQGEASVSRKLSAAIVDALRTAEPGVSIVTRDLVAAPPEHLTLATHATPDAQAVLKEFLDADTVVIGAALYNFTVPSQLKAWLDQVIVAGATFAYVDGRPKGMLGGKRVIVAVTRGGIYSGESPYAPFEHNETLLRSLFTFLGVTDLEFIIAEGLRMGPEIAGPALEAALAKARQVTPKRVTA